MHRPALPYKFKFKVSGCPNDCMNSIERADFAVIGTWRDDMKVDQAEVKAFVAKKGASTSSTTSSAAARPMP
jgi:dissimilatory sulfite reductase alpha subunit